VVEDFCLAIMWSFIERPSVYFTYVSSWAGHLFQRNRLLGLRLIIAVIDQLISPDSTSALVLHKE
jgi:hypothetical protein